MGFSIAFKEPIHVVGELGNAAASGEIVLGDYAESFTSPIGFWSPFDYQQHWGAALRRLVYEGRDSCLITCIHDPALSEYLMWWLLYPGSDTVFVQEALLLYANLERPFTPCDPFSAVPARTTMTEEGDAVSEWDVPIADFETFMRAARL